MFDRIIVSCDDSHFKDFWQIVAKSWNKYYPNVNISLAFVTKRNANDPLVIKMKEFGDIHLFPVVDDIPTPNLAKMARHILAGYYCDEICMIEDIDTIPLQTKFIENILSKRQKNKLLVVGSEVYNGSGDEGKFPISNMTAESYIFKSIINPDNLNIKDLYRSWINIKVYDHKESINNTPDPTGAGGFSDESLMRVLINKYNNIDNVIKITRNVNIHSDWIDRTWWNINTDKLSKDGYVCCNFLRPFSDNFDLIQPIVKHIFGENKEKNKVIL